MARTKQTPINYGNLSRVRSDPESPPSEPCENQPSKQPPGLILPEKRPHLDTFFPFQRLPLELRLKIWQNCFPPPRKVRLDLGVPYSTSTKLPRTLFINQESRSETLKQYTIVFPTDVFEYSSGTLTPPFCFNPTTDSLVCNGGAMVPEGMSHSLPTWVQYVGRQLSGGLDSITFLSYVHGAYPHELGVSVTEPHIHATYVYASGNVVEETLLKLENLKTLSIENVRDDLLVKLEQHVKLCLENNKDSYISGMPPNLIVTGTPRT